MQMTSVSLLLEILKSWLTTFQTSISEAIERDSGRAKTNKINSQHIGACITQSKLLSEL
jgi:hypothetical protein